MKSSDKSKGRSVVAENTALKKMGAVGLAHVSHSLRKKKNERGRQKKTTKQ